MPTSVSDTTKTLEVFALPNPTLAKADRRSLVTEDSKHFLRRISIILHSHPNLGRLLNVMNRLNDYLRRIIERIESLSREKSPATCQSRERTLAQKPARKKKSYTQIPVAMNVDTKDGDDGLTAQIAQAIQVIQIATAGVNAESDSESSYWTLAYTRPTPT
ncbi:unnamed protein product [Agarophyton chilense]